MSDIESIRREVSGLARVLRCALATLVVAASFPNVLLAQFINPFHTVFKDMLNGQPLPLLTRFIIEYQTVLIGISFILPVAAIATVFLGRFGLAPLYTACLLVLVCMSQLFITGTALFLPWISIFTNMSALS